MKISSLILLYLLITLNGASSQNPINTLLNKDDLPSDYKAYLVNINQKTLALKERVDALPVSEKRDFLHDSMQVKMNEINSRTKKENANFTFRKENFEQVSALCYTAIEERDASVLEFLGNNLYISFHSLNQNRSSFRKKNEPQKSIEDYPWLSLCITLPDAAIPYLERNMFSKETNSFYKVISFAVIQKINKEYSNDLYPLLYSQIDEYSKKMLSITINYPDAELWEIPQKFDIELGCDGKLQKRKIESQKGNAKN